MLITVPVNMVLLAGCYAVYEVYDKPTLIKPFEFLGVNALFFYCFTLLLVGLLQALYHGDRENTLWSNITDWTDGSEGNVLVFASLYLLLVICPLAYVLYDNGYVLKF
jgi:predicted acyltransferase